MITGGFHKIPEALKTLLDAEVFSLDPTWTRRTRFFTEAERTSDLRGIVVPMDRTFVEGNRSGPEVEWRIGVFIIQLVVANTEAEKLAKEDALMTLVDEIFDFLLATQKTVTVDGLDLSIRRSEDTSPPVNREALSEHKTFEGLVEVVVTEQ